MKKTIFILLLSSILVSCSTNDEPKSQKWDSNAMISLRPYAGTRSTSHLSAIDIVKQTTNLKFTYKGEFYGRGFADAQRDTVSLMLRMWGTDIIDQEGKYVPDFIEATDCILQRVINANKPNMVIDTVAYIPNSVLRDAEARIKIAYEKLDYTTCYQIFNESFTFIPITGNEWLALKAIGKE